MRREGLYLQDILDACDEIAEFTIGLDEQSFAQDRLARSAVLQKLMVIGEAAARLPTAFKAHHPEVEWRDIAALRNRIVHAYFGVEWPIIWIAAKEEVPILRTAVARMLGVNY